jgi:hypothetical protein
MRSRKGQIAGSIASCNTRVKNRPITLSMGQIYQNGKILDQRLADPEEPCK